MRLADLRLGDLVTLKLSHWQQPMTARVERFGKQHCQLHGEFIANTVTFRKIKPSGKESYLFDVGDDAEPDFLEALGSSAGQRPSAHHDSRGTTCAQTLSRPFSKRVTP